MQNTGIRFSIVANAPRKDPDEVFNAYGREGLEQAIEQTVSYASFAFDYLKNSTISTTTRIRSSTLAPWSRSFERPSNRSNRMRRLKS
ncbi:hypothetical protein [Allobaculum sp. Allo2]|uniref:hypothetical protein n=1 Tax=Allobaculum sp. Allo2 TaxID=2853432 RepID=UPI003462C88A